MVVVVVAVTALMLNWSVVVGCCWVSCWRWCLRWYVGVGVGVVSG